MVHHFRSLFGQGRTNAVEYIGNHKVDLTDMITYQVNLSEGPAMFDKIIANPKDYGKVLLYPEENR